MRAHQTILSAVEKSLKSAGMPPLSWYDVLLELDSVGAKGERAFLLQKKLLLPQYGLSRLINRIEKAGYLEKLTCDDDGRGQRLVITELGKDVRQNVWSIYSVAIEEAVGSKLSRSDGKKLKELLKYLM
ncbi:MAG: MarR family winged helix-turn-helix transcriptional regulator [Rhizobiaceae bacterium]